MQVVDLRTRKDGNNDSCSDLAGGRSGNIISAKYAGGAGLSAATVEDGLYIGGNAQPY